MSHLELTPKDKTSLVVVGFIIGLKVSSKSKPELDYTFGNKSSLKSINCAIVLVLDFIDSFGTYSIGICRTWNKSPSIILI